MSTFLAPHSVAPPHSTPAAPTDDPGAASAPADTGSRRRRSGGSAILFGPAEQPRWARPLLWLLLAGTAALYLVDLSASGYANEFYAAAVKAGTQSVKAWLFGSLDAGNSITVDKPPVSLWPMVLSARMFGFSSFSMLLPQALMGVGTVALTHAAVKRWSGPAAGLVAGALVALTPVAALMFRFNNPDALLTLLLVAGAYCTLRAIETASGRGGIRWLLLAGSAVGFAFLTKMGEALLVLPGFAAAYLVAAPVRVPLRLRNLLIALGAVVVSAGWYVALVELWPAADRPYIGGSTNNSLLELALGYNGISRLAGGDGSPGGGAGGGGGGGGPGGGGFGGTTGLLRMFNSSFRGEISWLLPAALLFLAVGLAYTWRSVRTDRTRAALLLWGGWLLVTVAVFSYMGGIIHPYYVVVLAPPIATVVAIVGRELWRGRANLIVRSLLAIGIAGTGLWGAQLLALQAAGWLPWLRWVVLAGSFAGAALLMISVGQFRRMAVVALLVGSLCAVGGAAGFTVATAATPHSGSIPTSGPSSAGGGFGGGFGGGVPGDRPDGVGPGGFRGGAPGSGPGGQAAGGAGGASTGDGLPAGGEIGAAPQAPSSTGIDAGGAGGAVAGSDGAPGTAGADTSITALLNATRSTWAAAVIGSQSAAAYELSTDTAVMAIGGFSGTDQSPTLAQFQQYVAEGRITYFIAGGGRDGGGGGSFGRGSSGTAEQITSWVEQNYQATTVSNTTIYTLLPATTR